MNYENQSILYFKVQDSKAIVFAEGRPYKGLNVIKGANGSGKSSLIEFLQGLIGGKKYLPEVPIRDGKKKSVTKIETEDYICEMKVTPSGNSWKIERKDGMAFKGTALSLFRKLTGDNEMFFNVSHLFSLKGKEQIDFIKQTFGIDTNALDSEYEKVYSERTNTNRLAAEKAAAMADIRIVNNLPENEKNVSDIMSEYKTKSEHNQKKKTISVDIDNNVKKTEYLHKHIEELKKNLEEKQKDMNKITKDLEMLKKKDEAFQEYDLKDIDSQVQSIEENNKEIRQQKRRKEIESEKENYDKLSKDKTDRLKQILEEKEIVLKGSKLPNDLKFTEDGLMFKGLPFTYKQTSDAEAHKILTEIAFSAIPANGLRVVMLINGGIFDQNALKDMAEIAEKNNGMILLERPDVEKDNCAFYFKEGIAEQMI